MFENTLVSVEEFERECFPDAYREAHQKELIEKGNYAELVKYIVEEGIELNLKLVEDIDGKNLGRIIAWISLGKIEKELCF